MLSRKKSSTALRDELPPMYGDDSAPPVPPLPPLPGRDSMGSGKEPMGSSVFSTSLARGMPMGPLPKDQLRLLVPDLPVLQKLWLTTAEALILDRKIVERPSDIRRNAAVMLELIREDRLDKEDEWWYGQGAHPSVRPPLDSIEEDDEAAGPA